MEPRIQFAKTTDGVSIAFATLGEGPPLVSVPNWISPFKAITHDRRRISAWEEMASNHRVVLYDRRGTGMSERKVRDFSRSSLVKDLEAVIDHLKLRRVALSAWDMAGPVAIEYAFRHPRKVSHLILIGCCARGQDVGRDLPEDTRDSLIRLVRSGWDVASEMWPTLVMPGADPEDARRFFTALRESCSGEAAAAQLEAAGQEDVTDLLPSIQTPTLVLHPRRDRVVPFELGSELASAMPNARLVPLDWETHWYPRGVDDIVDASREFLTPGRPKAEVPASGMITILFTDMEGSTDLTQRLGDAGAQDCLRTHNTIVRDALKATGGSEIKHTGDGIMASFPSASRALEAAVAIQRAFAEHNRDSAHTAIRVRIGLNAGEPVAEDEDLFGTAVQLAARVCAQAEPGQILTSNVVQELAAGKGFTFDDKGETSLKGFQKPVRLHEVRWRES